MNTNGRTEDDPERRAGGAAGRSRRSLRAPRSPLGAPRQPLNAPRLPLGASRLPLNGPRLPLNAPPDPPLVKPGPGRFRRAWPVIRIVVALAAVGFAIYAVSGKTQELTGVTSYLDDLHWWWMIVAAGAELLSYAALSSLQRRLLRAGKVKVPAESMMGITLAGSAIQYTFPGGSLIYLAYLFRQFRRWGADELLAGWVVLAFNLVTFVSLAALSAIGLALAFGTGSGNGLVESIGGIAFATLLLILVVRERRRLLPYVTRAVALSQKVIRRPYPNRSPAELVESWTTELGAVSPSRQVWIRSLVMGMSNWLADLSCLVLSFFAVGVGVPWRGLLLAYTAGQLASSLPITPGGLGAVEGSLTIALVNFGGGAESTVAAVLLYRLISFWMMLPIGWASWTVLALSGRRSGTPVADRPDAPIEGPSSGPSVPDRPDAPTDGSYGGPPVPDRPDAPADGRNGGPPIPDRPDAPAVDSGGQE